jgi:PAS domain-containing protein
LKVLLLLLYTLATFQERTTRKQTEAALRESEAQIRAIVEAIPDLMFSVDADRIFLGYFKTNHVVDLIPSDINPIGQKLLKVRWLRR